MNELLKYLALWQKKRSELPVDSDPQADWLAMHSLLDKQIPVPKKGKGFKGFGSLPAILVTLSAAAMIYTAAGVYKLEKNKKHHETKAVSSASYRLDSFKNGAGLSANSSIVPDSMLSSKSGAKQQEAVSTGQNHPAVGQPAPVSITDGKIKTNTTQTTASAGHLSSSRHGLAANNNSAEKDLENRRGTGGHQRSLPAGGGSRQNQPPGSGRSSSHNRVTTLDANNQFGFSQNNSPGRYIRADSAALTPLQPLPLHLPELNLKKMFANVVVAARPLTGPPIQSPGSKSKNTKQKNNTPAKPSNIDWGILIGTNTSGSFTPKAQNSNFYGSLPVDLYPGLFASYKLNTNWSLATQVQIFSPQNVITNYTHANQSKVDSGQLLRITASRKIYSINVPVYAVYSAGNGFSFKAGPVFSFPIKQINTNSVLQPYTIRSDTSYYQKISGYLNATQYRQSINFGVSAGVDFQFNRFIFGAAYMKSISGFQVSSGLGAFKSYNGTFQLTIGFQLDKVKH